MKFSPKKFAPNFQMLNRTWAFRKIEWKMQKEDQTWLKHELFWFKDYVQNEGRKSKTLSRNRQRRSFFTKNFCNILFCFRKWRTSDETWHFCKVWLLMSFLFTQRMQKSLLFFSCLFSFGKTNVPAIVTCSTVVSIFFLKNWSLLLKGKLF